MIYALYLNPTLDKTIYVENFAYGGTNRARQSILQGGGKALNLAVVLHRLGTPVEVAGFLCQAGCEAIERGLAGIPTSFVRLAGEPRTNLKIVDRAASVTTEVNEPGPVVSPEALAQLEAELSARLRPEDTLVLTGSLPQGCPPDYYAQLMRRFSCRFVLDASGEALCQGVRERPYLIKPNLEELSQLTGNAYSAADIPAILRDCRVLLRQGIGLCVVSMGGDGALIIGDKEAYFTRAVVQKPDSTVGAGDSMLAGLLSALQAGASLRDALALGTAASAATISLPGTTLASREAIQAILPSIQPENCL